MQRVCGIRARMSRARFAPLVELKNVDSLDSIYYAACLHTFLALGYPFLPWRRWLLRRGLAPFPPSTRSATVCLTPVTPTSRRAAPSPPRPTLMENFLTVQFGCRTWPRAWDFPPSPPVWRAEPTMRLAARLAVICLSSRRVRPIFQRSWPLFTRRTRLPTLPGFTRSGLAPTT